MVNIKISYFKSKYDNKIEQTENCSWDDFRTSMLSYHTPSVNKDFILFNGMKFVDRGNDGFVRRCADNVAEITLLILDYDGEETIDGIKDKFKDFEHSGYTSFSHKSMAKLGKDCFRVIMPLKTSVTMEFYRSRKSAILKWAGEVDQSSTDISRGFYLPSCPPESKKNSQIWHNKGRLIDISDFEAEIVEQPSFNVCKNIEDSKKQMIKEALMNIHVGYEPTWMKVMWAMKNSDYNLEDFVEVTVFGNLMDSKTVEDCKKRWNGMRDKSSNAGYLINLIRKNGQPNFLKKQENPKIDNALLKIMKSINSKKEKNNEIIA